MNAVLNPQIIKTLVNTVGEDRCKSEFFGFEIEFNDNVLVIGDINSSKPYVILNMKNTLSDGYDGSTKLILIEDYESTRKELRKIYNKVFDYVNDFERNSINECNFELFDLRNDEDHSHSFIQGVSHRFVSTLIREMVIPESKDLESIISYYEANNTIKNKCIAVFSAVSGICDVFIFDDRIVIFGLTTIPRYRFNELGPMTEAVRGLLQPYPICPTTIILNKNYGDFDEAFMVLARVDDIFDTITQWTIAFLSNNGVLLTPDEVKNIILKITKSWGLVEQLEMPPKPAVAKEEKTREVLAENPHALAENPHAIVGVTHEVINESGEK